MDETQLAMTSSSCLFGFLPSRTTTVPSANSQDASRKNSRMRDGRILPAQTRDGVLLTSAGSLSVCGFYLPPGEPRAPHSDQIFDPSVRQRMAAMSEYQPVNLPPPPPAPAARLTEGD